MSTVITATFTNSFAHAREAQSAAGPRMVRPALSRLLMVSNWIYTGLTAIGTMSILLYFLDETPSIAYFFVLLAAILITFGLSAIGGYAERATYADFVRTDFGASNTVEIDAVGFTLITPHSRWMTGWRDITDTFRTTNTLGIVTPVMPIYIPASALADPDAAFAQITTWHKAAVAK